MKANGYRWNRVVFITFIVVTSLVVAYFVSNNFAVQNAIRECDSFHLKAEAQPFNIRSRINTYEGAFDITEASGSTSLNNSKLPVWIIDLDGRWLLFGGPPPEDGQPDLGPQYFDHCTVIINAFTGHTLSLHAKPISVSK